MRAKRALGRSPPPVTRNPVRPYLYILLKKLSADLVSQQNRSRLSMTSPIATNQATNATLRSSPRGNTSPKVMSSTKSKKNTSFVTSSPLAVTTLRSTTSHGPASPAIVTPATAQVTSPTQETEATKPRRSINSSSFDEQESIEAEEREIEENAGNQKVDQVESKPEDGEQHPFDKITDYRWIDNLIELRVKWEGSPSTWEPEENLHRDAPDALFEFWREQGGRPENPDYPDLYEIFAIRDHSKDRKKLLVEWLGYDKPEWSWQPRREVEKTAKEAVDAYFEEQKRKTRKRRGRKQR